MVRIDFVYAGELHTRSTHGPSNAELATDAPVDNRGRGASFSPTDLVATGLGSCMLTTMGIVASDRGWKIDGATASVEKHMVTEPHRRIGRLVARLDMPPGLDAEARSLLEETAKTCPVARSIHPDIALDLEITWAE